MNRSGLMLVALLLVAGAMSLAQNTGWLNPSANSGAFSAGPRAYHDDTLYAEARNTRQHQYWGYAVALPAGSSILGIEVRLDAWKTAGGPAGYLYVELSWDGGVSWTATGYGAGPLGTREAAYVLGGPTGTWGRSWTPGEFASGLFRVRLTANCGAAQRIRLDWVTVRVYYEEAVALTLVVSPQLVDLGTLTLAHYDAGYKELSPAQRLTVSSGTSWSLYVAADSASWTYTGSEPPPGKPCSHLEWRVSASGPGITGPQTSYLGLTAAPQKVAGGTAGTDLWLDIALRVLVDYTSTVPGTYELRFTFTLTAP